MKSWRSWYLEGGFWFCNYLQMLQDIEEEGSYRVRIKEFWRLHLKRFSSQYYHFIDGKTEL